jgi:hypothetical protein
MQMNTSEKREYARYPAREKLCAVFESGTFGQLIDISKNGLSVLIIGMTDHEETTIIDVFRLCGTNIMNDIHCSLVRKEPVYVSKKMPPQEYQLYCLQFRQVSPSFDEQFNNLINQYSAIKCYD